MPEYTIKDAQTGRTVTLRGDSPPTEAELSQIFASLPQQEKSAQSAGLMAHAPAAAAMAGSMATAKVPVLSTLAAGFGGAYGAAARDLAKLSNDPVAEGAGLPAFKRLIGEAAAIPGHMIKEGAEQAAYDAAGGVLGKGLKIVGSGLYRGALLPLNQVLGKYGAVVKEGLENAIPVSKSGLGKATAIKGARVAAKDAALGEADKRVVFRAGSIADEADKAIAGKTDALVKAGEMDQAGAKAYQAQSTRFRKANPQGITPTELEATKRTMDDRLGGAYEKTRRRQPLTPREESRMAMSQAASRAQETAVPEYRAMNKSIMDASGLEQAMRRRVDGSAGNQGLENALTMLGGAAAIPARLAMLPPVLSTAGIAAHKVGEKVVPPATNMLRALVSLLQNGEEQ